MKEKYLDYHGVTVLWAEIKKFVRSLVDNAQGAMTGRIIFGGSVDEVFDGSEDVYVNIPSSTTPGTTDYRELRNLPSINGIELFGNKTTDDLKIKIPTKVSQLQNDKNYLTEHQSLAGYATTASVEAALEDKLTKTEAKETYQTKGNYLTAIPQEYVTDTELAAYTYNKDAIDTKISNGGNFDSSLYYTKKNINDLLANKQNAISDLEVIRAGANLGVTALQPSNEADPTVPAWAKSPNKPTYTASEVGALPSTTHIPNEQEIKGYINVTTNTIENGVPIAEVNGTTIYAPVAGETSVITNTVQSDWEEEDENADAYIKNKPTIPTAVSVTNTLSSGTRVATINGTDVYAPTGGGGAFLFRMYVDNSDNSCYFYYDDYLTLALACESKLCALCVGDNTNGYKIFQYYSCGGTSAVDSSYKGSYTFIRNEFNGTTITTEKIVITQGNSAEAYTGLYSLESIAFNYTSATSTLEITTN